MINPAEVPCIFMQSAKLSRAAIMRPVQGKQKHMKKMIIATALSLMLRGCTHSLPADFKQEDLDQLPHGKLPSISSPLLNPIATSRASVNRGHDLFSKYCESCHGMKADGRGYDALLMRAKPSNLTQIVSDRSDFEIFLKMSLGGLGMPEARSRLSESDRWNIVNFVKSLPKHPNVAP